MMSVQLLEIYNIITITINKIDTVTKEAPTRASNLCKQSVCTNILTV